MRQIKFKGRFNIKEDHKSFTQEEKVFIESKTHEIYSLSIRGKHIVIPYNNTVLTIFEDECKCIEILQFTGLVDRNGKEVYHKDRVNHENYGEGVIEWDDRFATFFIDFGSEDLELQMVILNECELLN